MEASVLRQPVEKTCCSCAQPRAGGLHTWDFAPGSDARREIPSTANERVDEAIAAVASADLPEQMRAAGRELGDAVESL
jgi:hypothetical protein